MLGPNNLRPYTLQTRHMLRIWLTASRRQRLAAVSHSFKHRGSSLTKRVQTQTEMYSVFVTFPITTSSIQASIFSIQ
jgi:hypothetical protein